MIEKILYSIALFIFILSKNVFADEINVQAAYGDAFFETLIKFVIAGVLFYLFTYGLIGRTKDTPLKLARWVGAILGTIVIVSSTNHYSSESNYIFSVLLATLGWYVIGFFIGYLWLKLGKNKEVNPASMNSGSKYNFKSYMPLLLVVASILGGWIFIQNNTNAFTSINSKNEFDVYGCKGSTPECKKRYGSVKFIVEKPSSQVIVQSKSLDNETSLTKIDNCVIIDDYNWECAGKFTTEAHGSIDRLEPTYKMVKGDVTRQSGYIKIYDSYGKLTFELPIGDSNTNYVKR